MDNNKLYHKIDEDDNLSDAEKREIYYSEISKIDDENES